MTSLRSRIAHAEPHSFAPHPTCMCGYCIVRDLDELVGKLADPRSRRAADARANTRLGNYQQVPLLVYGAGWGRCAAGFTFDPDDTARVEMCRADLVILPRALNPEWVEHLSTSEYLTVLGTANFSSLRYCP